MGCVLVEVSKMRAAVDCKPSGAAAVASTRWYIVMCGMLVAFVMVLKLRAAAAQLPSMTDGQRGRLNAEAVATQPCRGGDGAPWMDVCCRPGSVDIASRPSLLLLSQITDTRPHFYQLRQPITTSTGLWHQHVAHTYTRSSAERMLLLGDTPSEQQA